MTHTNRIEARFAALRAANKKALITYTTAGFPDFETFPKILEGLPAAGADLIEIGMPFTDPMADGPVIQEANNRALRLGIKISKILTYVREFRKKDNETPILLMGYYNPIYSYGIETFLKDAHEAGVDGFIIPDLPPEEDGEFRLPAEKRDMVQIRFVTPTTDDKRLDLILNGASGFLYYVSIAGITGTGGKMAENETLAKAIAPIRAKSKMPVAIGFGVDGPESARARAALADGVIVGTAIIKHMQGHMDDAGRVDPAVTASTLAFVKSLAEAVHS